VAQGREIGIDVEFVCDRFPAIEAISRYLTPAEARELRSLEPQTQTLGFYQCWTRKEAYLKARGCGLQKPLNSFQVSLVPGNPARFVAGVDSDWKLASFHPAQDYVAAVAASSGGVRLKMQEWKPDLQFN
jgi:4'-phosphopantetheinyl transferase